MKVRCHKCNNAEIGPRGKVFCCNYEIVKTVYNEYNGQIEVNSKTLGISENKQGQCKYYEKRKWYTYIPHLLTVR